MDNQALALLVGVALFGALAIAAITRQEPAHHMAAHSGVHSVTSDRYTNR